MRLIDFLDKGASLGSDRPCLTMGAVDLSYAEVQRFTYRMARALQRDGVVAGEHVAVLSGNDPYAFASVFAVSRAGAVWCPISPRNEVPENSFILDSFDCSCLIFHSNYAEMVSQMLPLLPKIRLVICIDKPIGTVPGLLGWLGDLDDAPIEITPAKDIALIAGTGGTTGKPKGVMLSGQNMEAMTAAALMSFEFGDRPIYLAVAPLTHAAGVLCFPIMALGGRVVIMPSPDLEACLAAIGTHRVTHIFLPPTLIYMLLDHPALAAADFSSLRCFWYGAAPISPTKLATAIETFGPVMAQFFGQTEAPMMLTTMPAADHFAADGSIDQGRLRSAGRASPLVTLAIMDEQGGLLPTGQPGEIVVRGSIVMVGYYKNPDATAEAFAHGWHHTGDIGYLDSDGFLYIVDRAKDMIITGGFNVYSVEVEQALLAHAAVQDCAVIGLPDEKWGERVTAVVQLRAGAVVTPPELKAFVKQQVGSVKTPKQVAIWTDLPRSKIGKVLKKEIRAELLRSTVV